MTVITALGLARDFAAILLVASILVVAGATLVGAGVIGGQVAGGLSVAAVAALVAFAGYGLLAGVLGLSGAVIVAIAAVFLAGLAAYGFHQFGVRGLWLAVLATVGVGAATLFITTFAWEAAMPWGVLGPAVAFAALAALLLGTLGVTARAIERRIALDGAAASDGHQIAFAEWRSARRFVSNPPNWFDCAFASLGAKAARPGLCAANPPDVESAPAWAQGEAAPLVADLPPSRPELPGGDSDAVARENVHDLPEDASPDRLTDPSLPATDTPNFAQVLQDTASAPGDPDTLSKDDFATGDVAAGVAGLASTRTADQVSDQPERPLDAASLETPVLGQNEAGASPASLDAVRPAEGPSSMAPRDTDAPIAEPKTGEDDALRTAFVCFPALGSASDDLCDAPAPGVEDFAVSWQTAGGDARAAVDQVECYADPDYALHLTVVLNLSGSLTSMMPR
ncbi:MAG: hypothetical protein AAFV62_04135, partial [Pseudomonadota bacterium]